MTPCINRSAGELNRVRSIRMSTTERTLIQDKEITTGIRLLLIPETMSSQPLTKNDRGSTRRSPLIRTRTGFIFRFERGEHLQQLHRDRHDLFRHLEQS